MCEMTQICGKWLKYVGKWLKYMRNDLKYVGIDKEILENG